MCGSPSPPARPPPSHPPSHLHSLHSLPHCLDECPDSSSPARDLGLVGEQPVLEVRRRRALQEPRRLVHLRLRAAKRRSKPPAGRRTPPPTLPLARSLETSDPERRVAGAPSILCARVPIAPIEPPGLLRGGSFIRPSPPRALRAGGLSPSTPFPSIRQLPSLASRPPSPPRLCLEVGAGVAGGGDEGVGQGEPGADEAPRPQEAEEVAHALAETGARARSLSRRRAQALRRRKDRPHPNSAPPSSWRSR